MRQKTIWAVATVLIYVSLATILWTLAGGRNQYDDDGAFIPVQKQEIAVSEDANPIVKMGMRALNTVYELIPARTSEAWYFIVPLPVFLFSFAFWSIRKRMLLSYYENGPVMSPTRP